MYGHDEHSQDVDRGDDSNIMVLTVNNLYLCLRQTYLRDHHLELQFT